MMGSNQRPQRQQASAAMRTSDRPRIVRRPDKHEGTTTPDRVPLYHGLSVGRQAMPGQVVLDHPNVSRRHAAFEIVDGGIVLRDLGGINGTYVNGARLRGTLVPKLPDIAVAAAKVAVSGYWLIEAMKSVSIAADGPIRVINTHTATLADMTAEPTAGGAAIVAVQALAFLLIAYLVTLLRDGGRDRAARG